MDYQEDKKSLGVDDIDRLSLDTNEIPLHAPSHDMREVGNKAVSSTDSPATPAEQNIPGDINPAPATPQTIDMPMPTAAPEVHLGYSRDPLQANNSPELGRVVNLEMPPGTSPEQASDDQITQPSAPVSSEKDAPQASAGRHAIRTTDRLNEGGIKNIDDAINKLNQDGNISDFYDLARNMMEENLENSYQRKLSA